jgi:hypothetical protein
MTIVLSNFFNLTNIKKLHILNTFRLTPFICLNFYLKLKSKSNPFEEDNERFHNINFPYFFTMYYSRY